ncbi:hypothetical protein [Pseudomonas koreensis]|uniref:hypothetical protein n=1 Tax=Pseudomonas koreensis TaxID=198620 RepID=UPI0018E6AC35|nr:hypothetical protein [Pseudomonas koreensis]MBI6950043.1 hypothetical protein [Pseudomonas koreensis]
MSKQKRALEAQAREVAVRHGCIAVRSTKRLPVNGGGGFQVVDAETCFVKAGQRFDLSAEQVIQFFEGNPE